MAKKPDRTGRLPIFGNGKCGCAWCKKQPLRGDK